MKALACFDRQQGWKESRFVYRHSVSCTKGARGARTSDSELVYPCRSRSLCAKTHPAISNGFPPSFRLSRFWVWGFLKLRVGMFAEIRQMDRISIDRGCGVKHAGIIEIFLQIDFWFGMLHPTVQGVKPDLT